jgi:trehalose 6-phosphate phosphatase
MIPLARRALRSLSAVDGIEVAMLSGRTARDVAGRVRVGNVHYLGNHGIERARLARRGRATALSVETDASLEPFAPAAEALAAGVPRLIPDAWLVVERKGPSVAFHFRSAPDTVAAGHAVAAAVDELDPGRRFARFPGRRVLELRPPGAGAKGDAMRDLLRTVAPAAVIALGDDRSDAEAFLELRDARDAGAVRGIALAVQARAEAPPDVAAAADLVLASPLEASRFLSALARAVRR